MFHLTLILNSDALQDTNCVADDKALSGDTVSSPQPIVQVVGSDIAAVGGMVVQGFHFLMVALQNRTILQVCVHACYM